MRGFVVLLVLALVAAWGAGCSPDPERPPDEKSLPTGLPSATAPPGQPASGPLGLKWSWFQPETLAFVHRASGGWTFVEVEWCEVEPAPGQRDWSDLDELVRRSVELGHEPMLKLRTGQCWGTLPPISGARDPTEGTTKTASTPPAEMATYLDFVTSLVRRYAALGVHEYALENEIDAANFWAADTAAYESLVRQVAPAIRRADASARVLEAGLSSTGYGVALAAADLATGDEHGALSGYRLYYGRRLEGGVSRWPGVTSVEDLRTVLAGEDARRSIEALDVAVRLVREGVVDAYQLHFYEDVRALPALLGLLSDRMGPDVVIEAWEVGVAWPGDGFDERAQAEEVFRLVALLLAAGIRPIVYLPVAFTPGRRTQVFRGLVHEDGSLLPAGLGWIALADSLADLGRATITPVSGALTGVSWSSSGRDAAIVWATRDPAPLPRGVERVVAANGVEIDLAEPVGPAPVLLLGQGATTSRSGCWVASDASTASAAPSLQTGRRSIARR